MEIETQTDLSYMPLFTQLGFFNDFKHNIIIFCYVMCVHFNNLLGIGGKRNPLRKANLRTDK